MSLLGRKERQIVDTDQATIDGLLRAILTELQAIRIILVEAYEPLEEEHGEN